VSFLVEQLKKEIKMTLINIEAILRMGFKLKKQGQYKLALF
jgi:hypothetical protein